MNNIGIGENNNFTDIGIGSLMRKNARTSVKLTTSAVALWLPTNNISVTGMTNMANLLTRLSKLPVSAGNQTAKLKADAVPKEFL